MSNTGKRCIVIGAGMAGLTAGRQLHQSGWHVTLLDKGRTAGGRMATRCFGGGTFDHGAQFFTARDARFQAEVNHWLGEGVAREWFRQEGHSRYCGVHGMNAVAQFLAQGLDVRVSEHVERVFPNRVETRNALFEADAILLTAPIEQSLAMLQFNLPVNVRSKLETIVFEPCFAAMALLNEASGIPDPGYKRPEGGPIAWMADNQQKGISALPAVTLHATPEFTTAHWDTPREEVGRLLIEATGYKSVREFQVQRWKYSMLRQTLEESCVLVDNVAFAGDAFGGPRVEGAYLSGLEAAEALLHHL